VGIPHFCTWFGAACAPPRLALALTLLIGAASACTGDTGAGNPRACTEEARASVMVFILDAGGAPFPGASVTWRANGGEAHPAECVDFSQPPSSCTRFVAGWEVPGAIDVRAEKVGFLPATAAVTVPMDEFGCHVLTREVSLVMRPFRDEAR